MLLFTLGIGQDVINEDHNDITKYSYSPYLVEKVVLGTSSGGILI
jgi:hypothetical protein